MPKLNKFIKGKYVDSNLIKLEWIDMDKFTFNLRHEDKEYLQGMADFYNISIARFLRCLINAHKQGNMTIDTSIFEKDFKS